MIGWEGWVFFSVWRLAGSSVSRMTYGVLSRIIKIYWLANCRKVPVATADEFVDGAGM